MKKVSQLVQNPFFFSQKMLKKELNEGYISEKWNESMQKQTCFFRLLTEISINFASKCWLDLQFFTFIKRPITNISRNFEGWFNFNFYPQVTAYDADWMNNNTKFHHCEIWKNLPKRIVSNAFLNLFEKVSAFKSTIKCLHYSFEKWRC